MAYEAGWRASQRTTTYDLDAAEARFEASHGSDFGGTNFAAGWVDVAAGNPKWTSLVERVYEAERDLPSFDHAAN